MDEIFMGFLVRLALAAGNNLSNSQTFSSRNVYAPMKFTLRGLDHKSRDR